MKNQILVAGLQGWFNFYINASSLLIVGPTVAIAVFFGIKIILTMLRYCNQEDHQTLQD